jgi:hypothetical protein
MSITDRRLPRLPSYLVDAYEGLQRNLDLYDLERDERALVRALFIGCEQLNRFAEDSTFWDDLGDIWADSAERDFVVDIDMDLVLDSERDLLTQAGMEPRYVAVLLDQVEVSEAAWRASQRTSDLEMQPARSLEDLRERVRSLASATCDEWQRHSDRLQPTVQISTLPQQIERPGRLRRIVKRVVLVVAGGVLVGVDVVAGAHGVISPDVVSASAEAGFRVMTTGTGG